MSPTTEALMKVAPLRAKRMARNLSLRSLAKKVGVSYQAIANYENAINVPSPDVWKKIKNVLELDGDTADYFEEKIQGRPAQWDGKGCAFEGCERDASTLGLCTVHYMQYHKGKELKPIGDSRHTYDKVCKYPGCEAPHRSHGYCNAHYHQSLRGDTLTPIKSRRIYADDAVCNVLRCNEKPHAKGLCVRHYGALRGRIKKLKKKEESS